MYQKDYILRLIEACSIALARIIGLKDKGKNKLAIDEIKKVYDEMLKIDINQVLRMPANKIEGIEIEKLEMIADLLKTEGELEYLEDNKQKAQKLFEKSLELLKLVDQKHHTYSFERINKIKELENLTKQ